MTERQQAFGQHGRSSEPPDREAAGGDDTDLVAGSYLAQVAAVPVLPPEEEARLLAAARQGDRAARKAVVQSLLSLVVEVVAGFQARGPRFLDLVQEGNLALLKAIDAADTPPSGFRALARMWVEDAIRAVVEADATDAVTVMPSELVKFIELTSGARKALVAKLNRPPTHLELAQEMQLTAVQFDEFDQQVKEFFAQQPDEPRPRPLDH